MAAKVKLQILNDIAAGDFYLFSEETECLIGRTPDCTIRFPQSTDYVGLSNRHCLLEIDPPLIWLRDLGSATGTFINDKQIGTSKDGLNLVRDGDVIHAGPMMVKVEISESWHDTID